MSSDSSLSLQRRRDNYRYVIFYGEKKPNDKKFNELVACDALCLLVGGAESASGLHSIMCICKVWLGSRKALRHEEMDGFQKKSF